MPEERGGVCGWGWTHWDGPDADGVLYKVYSCQAKSPDDGKPSFWYEVYVSGELFTKLEWGTDFQKWGLERGWRPVVSYTSKGSFVGYRG